MLSDIFVSSSHSILILNLIQNEGGGRRGGRVNAQSCIHFREKILLQILCSPAFNTAIYRASFTSNMTSPLLVKGGIKFPYQKWLS
jgi:hypothetical protein